MTRTPVRSWWTRASAAGAAGALALLPVALPAAAAASSAPSLGGWNVSADGNAVDIVLDNATGLAGIHPFTEADFPEAESQFQTGPFGSALATIFWPGSAGGNFGSLSTELGLPAQLEPILKNLNDPVRASSEYPAGPTSATYPKSGTSGVAEMRSSAGAGGASATSALLDQGAKGVLSLGSAQGTSSSDASSTATGTSSADVSGISILGLIDIGAVTSTAVASSNGTTASASASTDFGDITVLGQAASIGSKGLVLPNLAKALGPVIGPILGPALQTALSQEINALGINITEVPSTQTQSGAAASATSGALSIEITPPSAVAPILETVVGKLAKFFPKQAAIVPTLPGLLQGATLTITLGRATASSSASPPFINNFVPPSVPPVSVTPGTTPSVPASTGTTPASTTPAGTSPSLSTTPTTQARPVSPNLISLSSPLGWLAVLLGILAATAIGGGLWYLARVPLPEDGPLICPLGKENL